MAYRIMCGYICGEYDTPNFVVVDMVSDIAFGPVFYDPESAVRFMELAGDDMTEAWKWYNRVGNDGNIPPDPELREHLEASLPKKARFIVGDGK